MVEVTNSNNAVTRPRKRIWLRIGVAIFVFIFLVVLIHGIRLVSPKSIVGEIDKNLGPDSDITSVLHFMDTHHILYVGCVTALHTCYGKIYNSSIGLMKSHILIEFTFNEDGKLVSHNVHEGFVFAWE